LTRADVEAFGSAAVVEFLGQGNEVTQVPQFEGLEFHNHLIGQRGGTGGHPNLPHRTPLHIVVKNTWLNIFGKE